MSYKLQRFDFGTLRDFRGPLVVTPEPEETLAEEVYVPPAPTFSEEELEIARGEARQTGYAEGFEAGIARANEQQDARRTASDAIVMRIGEQIQGLRESYQQLLDRESEALTQLVQLIAKKVAGEALAANSAETISALVTRCLPVIMSKPRLNIELHPGAFEHAIGQIETLLHTSGFEGEIQFRTNPLLGEYDAVLDWGMGQAERRTDTLWQEIEALLAQMPVTLAPLPGKPDIQAEIQPIAVEQQPAEPTTITPIE